MESSKLVWQDSKHVIFCKAYAVYSVKLSWHIWRYLSGLFYIIFKGKFGQTLLCSDLGKYETSSLAGVDKNLVSVKISLFGLSYEKKLNVN